MLFFICKCFSIEFFDLFNLIMINTNLFYLKIFLFYAFFYIYKQRFYKIQW